MMFTVFRNPLSHTDIKLLFGIYASPHTISHSVKDLREIGEEKTELKTFEASATLHIA